MATAAKLDPYPHIVSVPGVVSGRPHIDGTRVRVMDVVLAHRDGASPDEMRNRFASRSLTLAEVHSALAYYYDHQAEIDEAFAGDERAYQEGIRRQEQALRERSAK
jgi:uncharacterized protein (DUF433 family)